MKPVMQKRTGVPAGQCTEASIASILECELEDVPDLWSGDPNEGEDDRSQELWNRMLAWLRERGYMWCRIDIKPCAIFGFNIDDYDFGELNFVKKYKYHMLGGNNPDGIGHMIVAERGRPVHDPNPSQRFIVDVSEIVYLIPLDDVPANWKDWPMIFSEEK